MQHYYISCIQSQLEHIPTCSHYKVCLSIPLRTDQADLLNFLQDTNQAVYIAQMFQVEDLSANILAWVPY